MFFGLSAMHTRRDLLRAVMEGVTYSLKDCLNVLAEMGVAPETMLACGGGGKSPLWRQMLADVFQMPVATTVNTEGPALGVAILAGVGAGLYASVPEACRAMIHVNPAQNPIAENVPQYEKGMRCIRLYQANKGLYKELAKTVRADCFGTPKRSTRKEYGSETNSIARRGQGAIAPCGVQRQRLWWGLGQRPNRCNR